MGADATEAAVRQEKKTRIKQPKTELVQTGKLNCEYQTDPENGITHVIVEGHVEFDITERALSDGTPAFFYGVLESAQLDLRHALERSARAVAGRAVSEEYAIQNPRTSRAVGRMSAAEFNEMKAKLDAINAEKEALAAQAAADKAELAELRKLLGPELKLVSKKTAAK